MVAMRPVATLAPAAQVLEPGARPVIVEIRAAGPFDQEDGQMGQNAGREDHPVGEVHGGFSPALFLWSWGHAGGRPPPRLKRTAGWNSRGRSSVASRAWRIATKAASSMPSRTWLLAVRSAGTDVTHAAARVAGG